MKIMFSTLTLPATGIVVLMIEGSHLGVFGKQVDKLTQGALTDAMKLCNYESKCHEILSLLRPAHTKLDQIILVGLGKSKDMACFDFELLGGTIYQTCAKDKGHITVMSEVALEGVVHQNDAVARMALGAKLGHYKFDKYKTKSKKMKTKKITFATSKPSLVKKVFDTLSAVSEGVCLARDLVNEPANILTPPEFAKRTGLLKKHGVKVTILNEQHMQKLGMGSLLAVGQGSVQPSKVVVMEWSGDKKDNRPIAFLGKGVCFDSGGISIKPSANMGDMRGDMGGAAAVTGLMYTLANRKARVNVVGVIGLVENMPSGEAQRPGDIVTSMSGQTIEVLNTDAEGRLVLADVLWYTQKRFKPKFMVDLATLTGAILLCLGQEYAGLFSNDDLLSERLTISGKIEGEKVWRMPLCEKFDKMIDTENADMQNIGGRYAGSATAAQFLQRFTNNVPWVHLDIAGMATGTTKSSIKQSWASGYGVKLLNRFVQDYYEN